MKYLMLLGFIALLSGCVDTRWSEAIAHEKTLRADSQQALVQAQIDREQSGDADRRDATTLLQALQTQNSIVQGQAVIAQADAQTAIVTSNNETMLLVAELVADASETDYSPLYGGMAGMVVVAVVWIVVNRRRPAQDQSAQQARQGPPVVYQTDHAFAYRLPDDTIVLHRYSDGKEKIYLPADPFYQRLIGGGK